ncbi:helix-turn-helix transcriptional regulator [Bradyrhizobium barranii subsp. barranii]|uniref:Helix-turn-helix transcriptional regulator n=1 Tax=Bradyrhizobium barranii subsp. barranii TaxID=2823807 RepID=A0A7Z0TTA3_9BRAD|nr:winged helix-turn-helix domain-containing protein [Bradyrhizobium barranii]UGX91123.1 helix-turn-helix transcriptional regulator [Bradyrhizobium barranii subsp. barranii]
MSSDLLEDRPVPPFSEDNHEDADDENEDLYRDFLADTVTFGDFAFSPAGRLLTCGARPIALGSRAMDILKLLIQRSGSVVTKKELMAKVWPNVTVGENGLHFQIAALRKALKDGQNGNRYIVNVSGRGYCFVAPTARAASRASVSASAVEGLVEVSTIPPALTRMVGRDDAVSEVSALLLKHRLVTVTGAAGVGKTTVAVSAAHLWGQTNGHTVSFVDFDKIDEPDLIRDTLASAFGLSDSSSDPAGRLPTITRHKRRLLVLDNCEHLAGAIAEVAERLLHNAESLQILVTSRETLQAHGERVYQLQQLVGPPSDMPLSMADALGYPASQMFIERVEANGVLISDCPQNVRLISQICERLDGIPLAIDIVARRAGTHGLMETAELLTEGRFLRWPGARTAPSRHQTLYASFERTNDLLTTEERSVFRCLSTIADTFNLREACRVTTKTGIANEIVVDIIRRLVTSSLVLATHDATGAVTYRLIKSTKIFALGAADTEDGALHSTTRGNYHLARTNARIGSERNAPDTHHRSDRDKVACLPASPPHLHGRRDAGTTACSSQTTLLHIKQLHTPAS